MDLRYGRACFGDVAIITTKFKLSCSTKAATFGSPKPQVCQQSFKNYQNIEPYRAIQNGTVKFYLHPVKKKKSWQLDVFLVKDIVKIFTAHGYWQQSSFSH